MIIKNSSNPLEWRGNVDGSLYLLDQRILPSKESWVACNTVEQVASSIRDMTIRGAPAIGIAAAFGMVLAIREKMNTEKARSLLAATRPTAVNLFWALEACTKLLSSGADATQLLDFAKKLHQEDIDGNIRMGTFGAAFLHDGMSILTHCNAGALATGGFGTALGVIFAAHQQGKKIHVFVDETRPRLQGARLTTWELSKAGVPHTLICDNMAASLMARGKIQACITGADRIAINGDAANKIGTYSVAVNARYHEIPFFIAAPRSTFDFKISSGTEIPIEQRDTSEVTDWANERTCAEASKIFNPGFDVTPAKLIRAIFTEHGVINPVNRENVVRVLGN